MKLQNMTISRIQQKIVVMSDLRKENDKLKHECTSLRIRFDETMKTKRETQKRLDEVRDIVVRLRQELAMTKDENTSLRKQNSLLRQNQKVSR